MGAGTSALAGVPTFGNFYETAEDICKNNLADGEEKKLFEDVLKHWHKNFRDHDIEQYYALIEMNEDLGTNPHDSDNIITTGKIRDFIFYTIQQSLQINTSRKEQSKRIFEEFFEHIGGSRSAIITTNWDTILEAFSKRSFGSVDYEGKIKPYNKEAIKQGPPLHILKLHGSLNWGICNECKKEIYHFKEMVDKKALCDVTCGNCKTKKFVTKLIPPTLVKLTKKEPDELVDIWKKAHEYIKSCQEIYFIGYSFPETDVQMKVFISNVLMDNKLNKICVVSNQKHGYSKVDFEERYLSILPKHNHSKIMFYYEGFEEFYKKLPDFRQEDKSYASLDDW